MARRAVIVGLSPEERRLINEVQDQFRLMVEREMRRIASMYGLPGFLAYGAEVGVVDCPVANCPICEARPDDASAVGDNAVGELVDLARAGDRRGFDALASCLMPAGDVDACWAGTRKRLGVES